MVSRDSIERIVGQAVRPLRTRLRSMVQRVVMSAITDSGGTQVVQVKLVGDHQRKAEHFQPAGVTSVPSSGQGVAFGVTGKGDAVVILGLHNRDKRPTGLKSGETSLYGEHDAEVILDENGDVILGETYATKAAAKALAIAELCEAEMEKLRTTINTHTHLIPGALGGGPGITSNVGAPQAGAVSNTASSNVKGKV